MLSYLYAVNLAYILSAFQAWSNVSSVHISQMLGDS